MLSVWSVLNLYEIGKGKTQKSTKPTTVQVPSSFKIVPQFKNESLGEENPSDHIFCPRSKTQKDLIFFNHPTSFK